jgi:DNA polymerase
MPKPRSQAIYGGITIPNRNFNQQGGEMGTALIGLDFETYGSVDLPKHGLDRYVKDPHFRPLLAGITVWRENAAGFSYRMLDFIREGFTYRDLAQYLDIIPGKIVAHNAGFEAAVLQRIGIPQSMHRFADSAVVARAVGAGSRLEAAAPQLLNTDKMAEGWDLIKLFSLPGKYQEQNGSMAFDPQIVIDHPDEWKTFKKYCEVDSQLGLNIVRNHAKYLTEREFMFQALTMEMNQRGWPVDLDAVREMQRRYLENQEVALAEFRMHHDAPDLNLNSYPQLKEWCQKRGVRVRSFDEKHVNMLERKLEEKIASIDDTDPKYSGYTDVLGLMKTKKILGGSSLKKLQTILDTVGEDGRLRDQYLHCGAGQSLRTTGRSVQMQNLKRIAEEPRDMAELFDDTKSWTNDEMAVNMRQVFTASHPLGELIVGDLSSIESRGLAWQAGEDWKLHAYATKVEVYKALAMKIYRISEMALVTKPERQVGKVGELSCGYGAGPDAVREFAANLGVTLTEGEATKLVNDWREANPETVDYWAKLQLMLERVWGNDSVERHEFYDGYSLQMRLIDAPYSLVEQTDKRITESLLLEVYDHRGRMFMSRVFIGLHLVGNEYRYYKSSDRKTGDLWKDWYINPKTKQKEHYKLYGGKLAGILTQSLCREIFFNILSTVCSEFENIPNVDVIGQFHDEIVLDWWPDPQGVSLHQAKSTLLVCMTDQRDMINFPMDAEVKSAYRYIK